MESAILETTSRPFLGQWQRLVSTTNWEKGRIIHQWREALRAADLPAAAYSDETWSGQVGSVTPQHVGRLRRVYERFGEAHDSYEGLFWSHFQAALDWDDAEMWLEGAVQNDWSIAEMRRTRSETLGTTADLPSEDDEVLAADWDEDVEPDLGAPAVSGKVAEVRPAHKAGAADEFAAEDAQGAATAEADFADYESDPDAAGPAAEAPRPFAHLPSLPADVSEAFESFKLCILKHKLAGWAEISRGDLVAALEALKELALAPAG